MKIAVIRQRYVSDGGAEKFVYQALMKLCKTDVANVSVLARKWKEAQGVDFIEVNPFYMGRLWRDWGFSLGVQRYMRTHEGIIFQSHERIPGCHIFRAGDGLHKCWLDIKRRKWGAKDGISLYHQFVLSQERKLFASEHLRFVICNSKMVMKQIEENFPQATDKCKLIYNGVDLVKFSPGKEEERKRVRQSLNLSATEPVLVYVGSGFERKGVSSIIDVMAASSHRFSAIVVGNDKNLDKYKKIAEGKGLKKNIYFIGKADPKPFYACADGFILPTFYDPMPNTALEALASGLPVLTTKQCGAAEIIRPGVTGFVFDAFNQIEMTQAIEAWLDSKDHWIAMKEAARLTALNFGWDECLKKMIDLYRSPVFS